VTATTSCVLQFKAVYANEVKTRDIPVTIREEIPEPVFALKAPSKWNGRDTIEVATAIYLNSPNESNLRQALDNVIKVYDVEFENNAKLRYIHKVKGKTDVYFFANVDDKAADTSVLLRGKLKPESWGPHAGKFSVPEYSHVVEDGQPVTRVKLALNPVHSLFIVASRK